jgi:IPT/TIG domain
VFAACCAVMIVPARAVATTVTLGPPVLPQSTAGWDCEPEFCPAGNTLAQVGSVHVNEVPADGTIKNWRVSGEGDHIALHVLRAGEEEGISYFGHGVSAPATDFGFGDNPTSLPVHAGDIIGIDLGGPGSSGEVNEISQPGAENLLFSSTPPAFGVGIPSVQYGKELLYSADVVLTPVVTVLDPAQGSAAGGTTVSIFGQYLDGATAVSFGATPARSFTVVSANQITAIAPASGAGQVDVQVLGPGGTSAAVAGDRYTFLAPPVGPAPGTGSPSAAQTVKPAVSALGQTASRWRRGGKLPFISRAGVSVGTIFSFTLNEAADTSFAFSRLAGGRRVNGRCVAVTPRNASKRRCTRTLAVGGFSLAGHAGVNKVAFQGRLSKTKTLKPGTYTLLVSAHSAGLASPSRSLRFTIVS